MPFRFNARYKPNVFLEKQKDPVNLWIVIMFPDLLQAIVFERFHQLIFQNGIPKQFAQVRLAGIYPGGVPKISRHFD